MRVEYDHNLLTNQKEEKLSKNYLLYQENETKHQLHLFNLLSQRNVLLVDLVQSIKSRKEIISVMNSSTEDVIEQKRVSQPQVATKVKKAGKVTIQKPKLLPFANSACNGESSIVLRILLDDTNSILLYVGLILNSPAFGLAKITVIKPTTQTIITHFLSNETTKSFHLSEIITWFQSCNNDLLDQFSPAVMLARHNQLRRHIVMGMPSCQFQILQNWQQNLIPIVENTSFLSHENSSMQHQHVSCVGFDGADQTSQRELKQTTTISSLMSK